VAQESSNSTSKGKILQKQVVVKNRSPFAAVNLVRSNLLLDNLIVTFLGVVAGMCKFEWLLAFYYFLILNF
jgi:hypothetical protein